MALIRNLFLSFSFHGFKQFSAWNLIIISCDKNFICMCVKNSGQNLQNFLQAVVRLYGLCLCVVCYMFYLESFVPFLNFTSSYPVLPIFEIILLPLTISPKCIINSFCQCSHFIKEMKVLIA